MLEMNQYEKESAIDAIDGYWSPPSHRTQKNILSAFDAAKARFREAMERRVECVEAITFEQFKRSKGQCFPVTYEDEGVADSRSVV